MRTISRIGIVLGILIACLSVYRWSFFYDVPYKMYVGFFVAGCVTFWAYLIDWMTMQDKIKDNLHKRMDSLVQEISGIKEVNDLK